MTTATVQKQTWWESLRHFGLLLAPAEVANRDRAPAPLPAFRADQLRRELVRRDAGDRSPSEFAAWVLDFICGLGGAHPGVWKRGSDVPRDHAHTLLSGEVLKPRHLWTGPQGGVLPVFLDKQKTLGLGRGRKTVSDCVQWLRAAKLPLALLTNGRQWRLLYAGLDHDAGCEWDTDLWFEEGEPGPQLDALRRLLQPALLDPVEKGEPAPLVAAILASRRGQSELSALLGERVREAVEMLVRAHTDALSGLDASGADIYRAAVRVVMRMVVVLFAESRGLLPRENPIYHSAYGLGGLFHHLERLAARGRARLEHTAHAWPRVLGLFRLIHDGSHHEALPVPAYGGDLFRRGANDAPDPVSRALHVFEAACFHPDLHVMPDRVVHEMLALLTRTRVRVRQGRTTTTTRMPVDFSDLSSEYIGILYEGLLDYELRTAPADDPIVFLAIGDEPALPLSRLEAMDEKQIKNLLEKLKDTSADTDEPDAEAGAEEASDAAGEPADAGSAAADDADATGADPETDETPDDALSARESARARALAWTEKASIAGGLVKKPRGRITPEKKAAHERKLAKKAKKLVRRVVYPGEWYLVRWGGTRKGSGTFYTRPQLAVPTVHRTLRPLAYDPPRAAGGEPDLYAAPERWTPKRAEEILALKVCDPACGSGSFLVASLRFLTDAVYRSLFAHGRLAGDWKRPLPELLGLAAPGAEETLEAERLPCRPEDDDFEPRLKGLLRRHVVERSIYGVDIDPLAVELCRLALWIETMDERLPFTFLDHKIRPGNSLVACWFDRFAHYPALAWEREGGDRSHSNGVHFKKDARTKALKAFKKERLRPDLAVTLRVASGALFEDLVQRNAAAVHDDAVEILARLHALPVQDTDDRARLYREDFLGSEAWRRLKDAFDLWCACWFWPGDRLDLAPLPSTFAEPPQETRRLAAELAAEKRFFHWELEFPDVFAAGGSGFDAIVGNPPWDIAKPSSKEFFSNIDPLYRSYGKQEALRKQTDSFADERIERRWLDYNADFRARSNFVKYAAHPFGDPETAGKSADRFAIARGNANQELHGAWRGMRRNSRGYADAAHPYRHQGSADINAYKLFLEAGHALLRPGGRLGLIVPSGLYSDHGTGALRDLFLNKCRWEWLFGFENREKIFDIDSRFKFNPVIIEKGGTTDAIQTAFMRRKLEDWEAAETHATPYTRDRVTQFSPRSKAILEIQSARDLEILEKIYANSVLLGDDGPDGWGIKYATEFHMTNDSHLFHPRPWWEEKGYRPDEYSRWLKGNWRPIEELWAELGTRPLPDGERRCAQPPYDTLPIPRADIPAGVILSRGADAWIREDRVEDVALPLYQGVIVGAYDPARAAWVSGTGLNARWEPVPWGTKMLSPQFLMSGEAARNSRLSNSGDPMPIGFRDIARTTDARTMICCLVAGFPCGNKVPILQARPTAGGPEALHVFLNSWPFDWAHRIRQSAASINYFVIEEAALPQPELTEMKWLRQAGARLGMCAQFFSHHWLAMCRDANIHGWKRLWALTAFDRVRVACMAEAVVAAVEGLSWDDLAFILRETDQPIRSYVKGGSGNKLPKGFWRVDKDKEPELRHTVLTLVAFHDLQTKIAGCGGDRERGIEAFCTQNDGEGWMLPETLRLADYDLGHDDRARHPQPVASRLGPRFYDWQLAQDPDESWRECELHARNLLGEDGYRKLQERLGASQGGELSASAPADRPPSRDGGAVGALFG